MRVSPLKVPINPKEFLKVGEGTLACGINPLQQIKPFTLLSGKFQEPSTTRITSKCILSLQKLKILSHINIDTICKELSIMDDWVQVHFSNDYLITVRDQERTLGTAIIEFWENLWYLDPKDNIKWYSDFLHDIKIVQEYRSSIRMAIMNEVLKRMDLEPWCYIETFSTSITGGNLYQDCFPVEPYQWFLVQDNLGMSPEPCIMDSIKGKDFILKYYKHLYEIKG